MKMTDLRKAAEQALEALKWTTEFMTEQKRLEAWQAMDMLEQALAQPEQEPVGYVTIETISSWAKVPSIKWFKKPTQGPLYTAPLKRDWVGLTDEEIEEHFFNNVNTGSLLSFGAGAAYAEAKLKEKNT